MEIKAEQLEKDIEAIPGVCKDAKEAIKNIFVNHFGVKFSECLKVEKKNKGKVFEENGYYFYLAFGNGGYHYFGIDDKDRIELGHYYSYSPKENSRIPYKLVANSPEEYFRLKFDGKL